MGPVEVRVDDHDVGHGRPLASGLGEAAPSRRAVVGARALSRADADHVPGPGGRLEAQIGPVTALRRLRPRHQLSYLLDDAPGRRAVTRRVLGLLDLLRLVGPAARVAELGLDPTRAHFGHPLATDVVAAPLEHGEVQRPRPPQPGIDQWQVLLGQLVLQRFRRGGHDHLLAAQRRRDEVGERLPGPGPGLDDEVGPRDHRLGHGAAHFLLLGPVLPAGHLRRDLGQPVDPVVAGLAGIGFVPSGGAEDIELVEFVGLLEELVVLVRHRR